VYVSPVKGCRSFIAFPVAALDAPRTLPAIRAHYIMFNRAGRMLKLSHKTAESAGRPKHA